MRQPRNNVSFLAVLALIGGILEFFGGMALLLGGSIGNAVGSSAGTTAFVLGAAMFGLGFTSFVLGYGFWRKHAWAWSGAFVVYGVSFAINLASVAVAGATVVSVLLPMVLAAVLMWYLLQPATKAAVRGTRVPTRG
jgi:hypothetical protein